MRRVDEVEAFLDAIEAHRGIGLAVSAAQHLDRVGAVFVSHGEGAIDPYSAAIKVAPG